MVDLNAHETGNGGKKPREAYSPRGLLYSEQDAEKLTFEPLERLLDTQTTGLDKSASRP